RLDLMPENSGSLDGISAVVVDDDERSCEVIAATLEHAGATVVTAHSAGDGLEALERYRPHVLVADIAMPGQDGYSLIQTVRRSPHRDVAGLPAVALTSLAGPEDRTRALRAGFDAHVPKPVSGATLTRIVETLTQNSRVH